MPVVVTDFAARLTLDLKDPVFATYPLSTPNMAMIFNKEDLVRTKESETDVLDFTAPRANVLVVDDNPVNLSIAEGLLAPLKMHVSKASDGQEAIRLCGSTSFDLILMDHMMPGMDGVETMHAIREKHPSYADKPIIALTANAVGDAKDLLIAEGMNDFIAKPIDMKTLIAKIRKWIPDDLIEKMTDEEKAAAEASLEEKKGAEDLVVGDLDVKSAVAGLGSEALFFNILKDYYRIIPEKSATIRKAWEEKDWKTYTIEVHSLKSTSAQIGAGELRRMAAELEDAGRAENEAFIEEHTEALLERYTSYADVFRPFCEEQSADDSDKPEAERDILKKAFDDFREAADNLDLDGMEEIAGRLSEYRFPDDEKELLSKLKDAVAGIDSDTALEVIEQWEKMAL